MEIGVKINQSRIIDIGILQMTKAEKRKNVTALSRVLKKEGFLKDKCGTFKKDDFKVDLRKDKVIIFIKHEGKYKKEYRDDVDKMTGGLLEGILRILQDGVKK